VTRVFWFEEADAELDDIEAHIALDNPAAARRMRLALRDAGDSLAWSPERGVPGSDGRRTMIVGPYLLRYFVRGDDVYVVSCRHGARRNA
jgi:plasmid stabilization system protein ParE